MFWPLRKRSIPTPDDLQTIRAARLLETVQDALEEIIDTLECGHTEALIFDFLPNSKEFSKVNERLLGSGWQLTPRVYKNHDGFVTPCVYDLITGTPR